MAPPWPTLLRNWEPADGGGSTSPCFPLAAVCGRCCSARPPASAHLSPYSACPGKDHPGAASLRAKFGLSYHSSFHRIFQPTLERILIRATKILDPVEVEREAITYPPSQVVSYLQSVLTQKVVAYLAGLKDARMVGAWSCGEARPRPEAEMRLRYAYQAARLLVDAYGDGTARSWFFGSNHLLDDEAPPYILRHAHVLDDLRLVIPAARTFARSGS